MHSRQFSVYILASATRLLYVGVTSELVKRVWQHKTGLLPGFTRRYGITRLVYVETTTAAQAAIAREKQIKGWLRQKKVALIESQNPEWLDLADEMGGCAGRSFAALRMTTGCAQDDNGLRSG